MSTAAHTPAPWHARPVHNGPDAEWSVVHNHGEFIGNDAWNIAEVYPHVRGSENAEANARLIAAAPDLLAACNACMEGKGDHITMMATAISKAEGRS